MEQQTLPSFLCLLEEGQTDAHTFFIHTIQTKEINVLLLLIVIFYYCYYYYYYYYHYCYCYCYHHHVVFPSSVLHIIE